MDLRHRHIAIGQRDRVRMLRKHALEGRFDPTAIRALKIGEFHNHDLGLGISANAFGIEPNFDPRRVEQNNDLGLLPKMCVKCLPRLLNLSLSETRFDSGFYFVEGPVQFGLLRQVISVQLRIGWLRYFGVHFLFEKLVSRNTLSLGFSLEKSLID